MYQYRVTKYDPAYRNELGHYTRDEWIMFSQVGKKCSGKILTLEDYEQVESSYIESAIEFLKEGDIRSLVACGVENSGRSRLAPNEGARLGFPVLATVMRGILREEFWMRLDGPTGFVHFGWDYYMYIGVPIPCESACEFARSRGLFVEPMRSPYLKEVT